MRVKKRKRQQGCEIAKAIDRIEKGVSTTMKIYRAVEPIAKAMLTNRRKTK